MKSTASNVFEHTLKKSGHSLTVPRTAVFELLSELDVPMSIREIIDRLTNKVDKTSIYRTVDLFEKLGIVQRMHIGWKYKIELSEQFSHHHHHATCTKCGRLTTFEESHELEARIYSLAESIGLTLEGHSLELRGICKDCH